MPSSASNLVFALRAAASSQRQGRRMDRMASRFGNIAIAAALLLAPLTASLGYLLPGGAARPAASAKSPVNAPVPAPLRQRPL